MLNFYAQKRRWRAMDKIPMIIIGAAIAIAKEVIENS